MQQLGSAAKSVLQYLLAGTGAVQCAGNMQLWMSMPDNTCFTASSITHGCTLQHAQQHAVDRCKQSTPDHERYALQLHTAAVSTSPVQRCGCTQRQHTTTLDMLPHDTRVQSRARHWCVG